MLFWYDAYELIHETVTEESYLRETIVLGAETHTFSMIGLLSSGIYTYDPTTTYGLRYFGFNERNNGLFYVGLLTCLMCLIMLIGLVMVRTNLLQLGFELDDATYTQSDFAIMGHRMFFDDYSEKGMEDEIREHMKTKYGIDDIEYICPAFKIRDFFEITEKLEELKTKRALIDIFLQGANLNQEDYKAMKKAGHDSEKFEDFPTEETGGFFGFCTRERPIEIDELDRQLEFYEKEQE